MPNYNLAGFDDLTAEELQLLDNLNSTPGEPVLPARRFLCRHIHPNGYRCGSPCLRGEEFCYYHHASRPPVSKPRKPKSRHAALALPLIEDHASLQAAVNQVLQGIAANQIDAALAGRLLYGLQIADGVLRGAASHKHRQSTEWNEDTSGDTRKHLGTLQPAQPTGPVEEVVLHPTLGEIAPRTEIPAPKPLSQLDDEDEYEDEFIDEEDETNDYAPAPLWDINANHQPHPNRKEELMPKRKSLAQELREQMEALQVRNIIEFGADSPEDEVKVVNWQNAQHKEELAAMRRQLEEARAATAAAELALAESKRVITIYHNRWLREKNRNAWPQSPKSQPAQSEPGSIPEIQAVAALPPQPRCRPTYRNDRNARPRKRREHGWGTRAFEAGRNL